MPKTRTPKRTLRELKKAPPGERFQHLYKARRESRRGPKNWLFLAGGLATIAIGVATYPVPVIPSELVILLGIGLIAQGSRRGARILDWIELRVRDRFSWAFKLWRPLSRRAKTVISVTWMVSVSALSYLVYHAFAE